MIRWMDERGLWPPVIAFFVLWPLWAWMSGSVWIGAGISAVLIGALALRMWAD